MYFNFPVDCAFRFKIKRLYSSLNNTTHYLQTENHNLLVQQNNEINLVNFILEFSSVPNNFFVLFF